MLWAALGTQGCKLVLQERLVWQPWCMVLAQTPNQRLKVSLENGWAGSSWLTEELKPLAIKGEKKLRGGEKKSECQCLEDMWFVFNYMQVLVYF